MRERGTSSRRAPAAKRAALGALAVAAAVGLGACGGEGSRQDADEPSGEFPVTVTQAQFPNRQRLAETSNLKLTAQNAGDEQIPELAVTIETDEGGAEPFSIRLDQQGLTDPNRPVWILEESYPKCISAAKQKQPPCVSPAQSDPQELDRAGPAGAEVANTNTFAFGELAPGDSLTAVFKLTPVMPGTYTVHYELAASLSGDAKATTPDGGDVKGEFLVTITDKPPKATVDPQGQIQIEE